MAPEPPKQGEKHREWLLVLVGIVSLFVMVMIYRRSQTTSGATTTTPTVTGALAQYQQTTQAQLSTLASQIQTLDYAVAGHTAGYGEGVYANGGAVQSTAAPVTTAVSTATTHLTSDGTTTNVPTVPTPAVAPAPVKASPTVTTTTKTGHTVAVTSRPVEAPTKTGITEHVTQGLIQGLG